MKASHSAPSESDDDDEMESQDADTDGTTGLKYVMSFVRRRLSRGADLTAVLNEFRVPESRWPPAPAGEADADTVQAVADTIMKWLQEQMATDAHKVDAHGFAEVVVRPYDGDDSVFHFIKTKPESEARWDPVAGGLKVVLNAELDVAEVRAPGSKTVHSLTFLSIEYLTFSSSS